jgi:hypothetical protein
LNDKSVRRACGDVIEHAFDVRNAFCGMMI